MDSNFKNPSSLKLKQIHQLLKISAIIIKIDCILACISQGNYKSTFDSYELINHMLSSYLL